MTMALSRMPSLTCWRKEAIYQALSNSHAPKADVWRQGKSYGVRGRFLGWSRGNQKGCKIPWLSVLHSKSGLSIEVSGLVLFADLSKPKNPALSLTAAVDARCASHVCFSISETILKLPKK